MNQYLLGVLFGGSLITSLGAISTYTLEHKKPTIKSVSRDFIIGSVLFVLIMQLLPDSSSALLTYLSSLTSLIPFNFIPSSSMPAIEELEIQVGMPQF